MSAIVEEQAFSPVAEDERASVLDALRGFALFGIFLSHLPDFSGFNFMAPADQAHFASHGIDVPLAAAVEFLITG